MRFFSAPFFCATHQLALFAKGILDHETDGENTLAAYERYLMQRPLDNGPPAPMHAKVAPGTPAHNDIHTIHHHMQLCMGSYFN